MDEVVDKKAKLTDHDLEQLIEKLEKKYGVRWNKYLGKRKNLVLDLFWETADAAAENALKWFIQVCEEGMAEELGITVEDLQEVSMPAYWVSLKELTK